MPRKPARMYHEIKGQSYTRKEYIRSIPNIRIAQFTAGAPKESFPLSLSLVVKEQCQIRDRALESARIATTKYLTTHVGANNFHMQIRTYPHVILREHKTATGAGADRVSSGMRNAFGKPIGTAVRIKAGQPVITVYVHKDKMLIAKEALRRASRKMPTPCRIVVG
jgi:large subunit ribosomal protein L10e